MWTWKGSHAYILGARLSTKHALSAETINALHTIHRRSSGEVKSQLLAEYYVDIS